MSREILHRGFHVYENGTEIAVVNGKEYKGRWVEGYYCKATRHWHKYGIHNNWIITSAFQNGGFFNVMGRYAVIPETVCEFTGLIDKNGKKIFDNDKVYCLHNENYYTVIWEDCEFRIEDRYGNIICARQESVNRMELEVIGTIFDKEQI